MAKKVRIPTICMQINGSERKNHYAIYAGSNLIGDVSGDVIEATQMQACDLLGEASLRKRGLNPAEIKDEEARFKGLIEALKRQIQIEPDQKIRDAYRSKITDEIDKHSKIPKVPINVGIEMALCIREYLGVNGVDTTYSYTSETMDRITQLGWEMTRL
jgi:hypothetical protein